MPTHLPHPCPFTTKVEEFLGGCSVLDTESAQCAVPGRSTVGDNGMQIMREICMATDNHEDLTHIFVKPHQHACTNVRGRERHTNSCSGRGPRHILCTTFILFIAWSCTLPVTHAPAQERSWLICTHRHTRTLTLCTADIYMRTCRHRWCLLPSLLVHARKREERLGQAEGTKSARKGRKERELTQMAHDHHEKCATQHHM